MKHKYTLALLLMTFFFAKSYSQNCKSLGCARNAGQVTVTTTVSDAMGDPSTCYNLIPYKVVTWQFFYSPAGGTYTQAYTPTSAGDPLDLDWIAFDLGTSGPTSMLCPIDPSGFTQVLCNIFTTFNIPTGPGVDGVLTTTAGHFYAIAVYVWQSGQPVYTFDVGNPQIDGVDLTALNCPGVLPVKLSSFDAVVNDCIVDLEWTSETESNFKHYEVEYSTDARSFHAIGTRASQGSHQQYSYQHTTPQQGNIFYRLKMTDVDGRTEYSNTIALKLDCSRSLVSVYPNPAKDILNVNITNAEHDIMKASLYDNSGKLVYSGTMKSGTNKIDISKLSHGVYILTLKNKAGTQNIKITK